MRDQAEYNAAFMSDELSDALNLKAPSQAGKGRRAEGGLV